jgi:hypothetical protein
MNNQDLQNRVDQLEKDLEALNQEYYANNFSSSQDFNKYSRFNTRLKVPHYSSLALAQVACEVGDICEVGGKLYICTVLNTTMTLVGSQT